VELVNIEERFFKHIATDEQHLDEIKARGEAAMSKVEDSPTKPQESLAKTITPNLPIGNYHLSTPDGKCAFSIEDGGIIDGDNINGSVQNGRVIFTMGTKEYEGKLVNNTTMEMNWKDDKGGNGTCTCTVTPA
jgi:hypothetical protein